MNLLSTTASILLLLGCTHNDGAGASRAPSHRVVTLTAEREAAAKEAFRIGVVVGPLQAGHRLIARLPGGEIVGSIWPYGSRASEQGSSYVMALPAGAVQNRKLTLHLELLEKSGGPPRAPTDRELEKVELLIVPVR